MYTGILAESAGPGATFVKSCGAVPVFLLSALLCLCFELLHICFGILTFVGYRKKAYWMIGFVIVAHLAASLVVSCLLTFIGHGWKREDGRREETGLCVYVCFCCCFVFLFLVVCKSENVIRRLAYYFNYLSDNTKHNAWMVWLHFCSCRHLRGNSSLQ